MEPLKSPGEHAPDTIPSRAEAPSDNLVENSAQPEQQFGSRNEQTERRMGQRIEAAAQMPQVPSTAQSGAPPAPVVGDDDGGATVVPTDNTPLLAADEDLIEKEWVDKVKKVIDGTKDNPYQREQDVKKLQVEYVRKRYGREIGANND